MKFIYDLFELLRVQQLNMLRQTRIDRDRVYEQIEIRIQCLISQLSIKKYKEKCIIHLLLNYYCYIYRYKPVDFTESTYYIVLQNFPNDKEYVIRGEHSIQHSTIAQLHTTFHKYIKLSTKAQIDQYSIYNN